MNPATWLLGLYVATGVVFVGAFLASVKRTAVNTVAVLMVAIVWPLLITVAFSMALLEEYRRAAKSK